MEVVRSNLKPLIHQIPKPVHDFGISLLGSDICYKTLIWDLDLTDVECLKLAVSKGLGVAIVGVSAIVKLPQLFTILRAQSASGISFTSYVLETAAYLITLAYNARQGNPFSTYGENAFIAAQNVAIAALVLHFTNKSAGAAAFVALVAGGVYALFNEGLIDGKNMVLLQGAAGVLGVASKIPQILTIWSEGSTGQLSAFAVFNFLFGSLSRIFTTLQEVNDPLILYGYIAGFTLNLVLAIQMVYYWNTPTTKKAKTPTITIESEKENPIALGSGADVKRSTTPSTRRRA